MVNGVDGQNRRAVEMIDGRSIAQSSNKASERTVSYPASDNGPKMGCTTHQDKKYSFAVPVESTPTADAVKMCMCIR
eukprot:scaffold14018_cov200-Alexandrium_tamarense.AAC.6